MAYWLLKSEPSVFSIQDLAKSPHQTAHWDGVRNYQARNFLKDHMCPGDLAFFYHSSCAAPGIVGEVEIIKEPYPDPTALDANSPYFDPKCTQKNNPWICRSVRLLTQYPQPVLLSTLRRVQPQLKDFILLKKGLRLSVIPVTEKEWAFIQTLRD